MKTFLISLCALSLSSSALAAPGVQVIKPKVKAAADTSVSSSTEDWKGAPSRADFNLGALLGLGLIDSSAGLAIIPTVSKKIVEQGFSPEINNQVFLELQFGPVFVRGVTALFFSTHLRWDFQKDSVWSLYALGGLGGHIVPVGNGDDWTAFPRVGLGAMMRMNEATSLRFEISHELTALGVSLAL